MRTFLRGAQYVFFFAGLLALSYVGYVHVQTRIFQADQSQKLAEQLDQQQARQLEGARQGEDSPKFDLRASTAGPPAGFAIGKVKVPRIGLEAVFVQGDSENILKLAVGHLPGTALPGQPGNMVLAGHRDTFFRPLRNIRTGDRIVIESPDGSYTYEVESASVVAPTDLSVLRSSGNKELTLITCYPFSWIGSAPDRFVVRAR